LIDCSIDGNHFNSKPLVHTKCNYTLQDTGIMSRAVDQRLNPEEAIKSR